MALLSHFSKEFWWGAYSPAVDSGITSRPTCPLPLVVTTSDLTFRKVFELSWFDKLHVEMDLVWL